MIDFFYGVDWMPNNYFPIICIISLSHFLLFIPSLGSYFIILNKPTLLAKAIGIVSFDLNFDHCYTEFILI